MERLAMVIEETIKKLKLVRGSARGLYITMYLLACYKTGDDIEKGTVEVFGEEITPKELAVNMKSDEETIKKDLQSLVEVKLVSVNPLKITNFKSDNNPFIKQRRAGRANKGTSRGSSKGSLQSSGESSGIGKDRIGGDRKGQDDMVKLDFENVKEKDIKKADPYEVYRYAFGRQPSALVQTQYGDLIAEWGKDKVVNAMLTVGKDGYGFGNVEKVLRGEWNKKGSGASAEVVCVECGSKRKIAYNSPYLNKQTCNECGKKMREAK